MPEPLTGYEATSVADVESFLDDNPAASSDEVYLGTVGHSERAIAAVAAKRAGSGGGGSLPDGWVDNGDGTVTITGNRYPITINATGLTSNDQIAIYDFNGDVVFEVDATGGLNVDGSHAGQGSQYFNTGDFGIHRVLLGDSARFEVGNKDASPSLYVIEKGEYADGGGVVIYGGSLGLMIKGPHSAPPDEAFSSGDLALWFDSTAGAAKLMIKAQDAGGTFRTAAIALT